MDAPPRDDDTLADPVLDDTERLLAPPLTTERQRVLAIRSQLGSPDALQRMEAALELDRIQRVLLADVMIAQRKLDENALDPEASLALAVAYRRLSDVGVLEHAAERHVLEQAIKLFARAAAAFDTPPPPLLRMLIETARRCGRRRLVARLQEQLEAIEAKAACEDAAASAQTKRRETA